MSVSVSIRGVVFAIAWTAMLSTAAAQGPYAVGSVVQASPLQMEGYWQECTVVSGPNPHRSYELKCAKLQMSVPVKWIRSATNARALKPEAVGPKASEPTRATSPAPAPGKLTPPRVPSPTPAPSAEPVPSATPASVPAVAPRPAQTSGGGAVALGAYECWAYNAPRMLLNFKVTGPGRYIASDDSAGTFTFDAASKAIRFTGYLAESMPTGFTSIYHEPHGKPTVSFRGRSGFEASFCEKAQ